MDVTCNKKCTHFQGVDVDSTQAGGGHHALGGKRCEMCACVCVCVGGGGVEAKEETHPQICCNANSGV